ncbi:MAG: ABC transporter substrate-binding protein [Flavobacteriales bacterium]|nr:ABC transporter substrate-binding protein [Flavobacteriales bacterium]
MKFIDQIGHVVEIRQTPNRIISIVPSQTELLFDLGLEEKVVGITKFCIHPSSWFKSKVRVGGTKTLNFEIIKQLNPDLIIANKEENTKSEIEALQKLYPVWTSNICTLPECYEMIEEIGKITDSYYKANQIIAAIQKEFCRLKTAKNNNKKVLYLIWKDPYMTIGKSTFINEIMNEGGFVNAIESTENYPVITKEEIKKTQPELIFLSTEPYPFKKTHIDEFKGICPNAQIILVDGEVFSWYGSRIIKSPQYLIDLYTKIN